MLIKEMIERGIEMNRDARNSYGVFGALFIVAGLAWALWMDRIGFVAVGMGVLFGLGSLHAESLRRRLERAKRGLS